jgi:hypothetical protein
MRGVDRVNQNPTRTRARAVAVRADRYPHDYLHTNRPYEQTQSDIGGSLLLGAVAVAVLMALVVLGLV